MNYLNFPKGGGEAVLRVHPDYIEILSGVKPSSSVIWKSEEGWLVATKVNNEACVLVSHSEVVTYCVTPDTLHSFARFSILEAPCFIRYYGIEILMSKPRIDFSWDLKLRVFPYFILIPSFSTTRLSINGGMKCNFLP